MKEWINHPCISKDRNGRVGLKIFQFFYCEMNLPKYQKNFNFLEESKNEGENLMMTRADFDSIQDSMSVSASSNIRNNADYIDSIKRSIKQKMPFLQKLYIWWHKIDPVEDTFQKVKNSKGLISSELNEMMINVDKCILRAEKSNQLALIEKLREVKNVIACEMILSKNGYDKFVEESKIIEFFKRSDKGVRIDFIRNYSTLIPFSVLEKKEVLDKLGVFDNYVVMYYDPDMSIFKETEEDEEAVRKKDPILFGLIKGSRKLYFVDDWITDKDDLTLDELNIVVENATSRLAKIDIEVDNMFDNIEVLADSIHRVNEE